VQIQCNNVMSLAKHLSTVVQVARVSFRALHANSVATAEKQLSEECAASPFPGWFLTIFLMDARNQRGGGGQVDLGEEHGQHPGVVRPEHPGLRKVASADDVPAHQNGHVVVAAGLLPGVQHPGGAAGERGLVVYHLHPEGQSPNAVLLQGAHLHHKRERERYFKSHMSWWEHSSHFRLIGRGVPSVSVVSQLVYNFLWMASPRGNPQVPMRDFELVDCGGFVVWGGGVPDHRDQSSDSAVS